MLGREPSCQELGGREGGPVWILQDPVASRRPQGPGGGLDSDVSPGIEEAQGFYGQPCCCNELTTSCTVPGSIRGPMK